MDDRSLSDEARRVGRARWDERNDTTRTAETTPQFPRDELWTVRLFSRETNDKPRVGTYLRNDIFFIDARRDVTRASRLTIRIRYLLVASFRGGSRAPRHVRVLVRPVAVKRVAARKRSRHSCAPPRERVAPVIETGQITYRTSTLKGKERVAPRVTRPLTGLAPGRVARPSARGSLRARYRAPASTAAVANEGAVLGGDLRAVGFHERRHDGRVRAGFRSSSVRVRVWDHVHHSGHPLDQPPPPEQPAVGWW